jgi:hypothetical protein
MYTGYCSLLLRAGSRLCQECGDNDLGKLLRYLVVVSFVALDQGM